MATITERQISWMAGLYEGEGCVSIQRTGNKHGVRVQIASSDRDVIERLQPLFPGNPIAKKPPYHYPNAKMMWQWRIGKMELVEQFLELIYDELGLRRKEDAKEALEHIAERKRIRAHQETSRTRKDVCKHGHPLTPENTVSRGGKQKGLRRCKICQEEAQRRHRAK